jgi:hypothetical protein
MDVVLRTETNYLVFRGRVSGNTDEGRVFFLPYNQIDFVQINRQVKEVEIREMFGDQPGVPVRETVGAASPSSDFPALSSRPGSHADMAIPFGLSPSIVPSGPLGPGLSGVSGPLRGSAQGAGSRSAVTPAAASANAGRINTTTTPAQNQPAPTGRLSNVPAAALVPPASGNGGSDSGEQQVPPRNSILERLRAQRNSILPPRPPGR